MSTTTTTTTATTTTSPLDVNVEAKRILAVSISKLYASRSQRGGLRLHRSLLLSLVMRSARDIYHSACLLAQEEEESSTTTTSTTTTTTTTEESMDLMDTTAGSTVTQQPSPTAPEEPKSAATEEEDSPRGGGGDDDDAAEMRDEETDNKENQSPIISPRKRRGRASEAPDFLPSKRARLEPGEERHAVPLALGGGGGVPSGAIGLGSCRAGESSLATLSLNRIIPAF